MTFDHATRAAGEAPKVMPWSMRYDAPRCIGGECRQDNLTRANEIAWHAPAVNLDRGMPMADNGSARFRRVLMQDAPGAQADSFRIERHDVPEHFPRAIVIARN